MRFERVQGSGFRVHVRVINLHKAHKVNVALIGRIAEHILGCCRKRGKTELEIVFLDNRLIKSLNKRFKGKNIPTDVLSFDLSGEPGTLLGNIFISIDKAVENSRIFKTTLEKELALYIIHGILHLAGYDDETKKERARMDREQKIILGKLCKKEDLSKVLTRR